MFLRYVHSFRACAIILIVAGHAITIFNWPKNSPVEAVLADLLENGTVLFVFVAGFLFHHLSERFRYRDYLIKKLKNVILPYVIVSAPAVLIGAFASGVYGRYPALAGSTPIYRVFWFLIKGGASVNKPLWFIPMIAIYYVAAPLLILFVRHPRLYSLLIILIPFSLLAHRDSEPNLDTLGLSAYYLSAYVLGMYVSHQRKRIVDVLDEVWPSLLAVFALGTAAMTIFEFHHGNYDGASLFSDEHGLIDWTFAQKLCLCFALLGLMHRYEGRLAKRLNYLGETSFTVFFVHFYFVVTFTYLIDMLTSGGRPPEVVAGGVIPWFVATCAVLALSLAATMLGQRVLGARSRFLIGS